MSGVSEGNIYGGIAQGINSAVSNITNLYGMQKHFEMQQKNLDIHAANAANYEKMMQYSLASRLEKDEGVPQVRSMPKFPGSGQRGQLDFGIPREMNVENQDYAPLAVPNANAFQAYRPKIGG